MNPERIPHLSQSEITSPVHALDEDRSGTSHPDPFNPYYSNVPRMTGRIDTSNFGPYAANIPSESPNSENFEVSEISSLQHINDYFVQSIRPPLPALLPESTSEKRETRRYNERFSNNMGREVSNH